MKEYKVDVYFGEKPKENTGGTMKAYKIDLSGYTGLEREVISKAVQEKAFELGWEWTLGKKTDYTDSTYLFFWKDGTIGFVNDIDPAYYRQNEKQDITVPDFLALKSDKDDEKPAHTFKPFDKVLVRDDFDARWLPDFFGHYNEDDVDGYAFSCVGGSFIYCIPYEGNEELIGTNKEPKE